MKKEEQGYYIKGWILEKKKNVKRKSLGIYKTTS